MSGAVIKPTQFGTPSSPPDLHNLDIIEDKSGSRRRHGQPARYSKGRFLGKGGFAKVYEVQDMETKEIFAAKIVAKASVAKPRAHAKLRSEIAIHRALDHDKVVKFYDYFEDSDYVYIILELCPNQTLNEFMRKRPSKRLSEPEAMFYAYDLIMALKYLHRRKVLHRDLKLGNLFLDADVRLKVGDFGLAAQLEHDGEKKRTICGTPNYIAPEILEGKHGHSYEVDIWSLGVILYTMIIGRPPFETSDVKTTYKRIRINQYCFPDNVRISQQARDLITSILRTDPRSRPSLDEIIASPWFQSQRLPPAMPVTVSAFSISPRVQLGNASARSETPERGVADFARIDSPVPRFPLRDRSPSSVPGNSPLVTQALVRGNSAGLLKQPPTAPPGTPGRYQQGLSPSLSRPPMRGNEENMVPAQNVDYAVEKATCRPQSAGAIGLGSLGLGTRVGSGPIVPQKPVPSLRNTFGRDASPIVTTAAANTGQGVVSARALQSNRSGVCSPRANPLRKDKEPRSLATSGSEGAFSGANSLFKTTPVILRGNLPSGRAGESSGYHPLTPPSNEDVRPMSERAQRNERSSSSPALIEGLQRDPGTPRSMAFPDGLASVRKAPDSARPDMSARDFSRPSSALRSRPDVAASGSRQCPSPVLQDSSTPELWVTKWVDYSSKYGVGYILSDGSIGVYFNDSTKIVLVPEGNLFDYVTRRTQEKPEVRTTHSFEDYPEELKKKVTLLRHFKNYMLTDVLEKKDGATAGESSLQLPIQRPMVYEPGTVPYVKKWTRNKHAIMFQLSNKIVQVIFFDKTEAVLSSRSHTVTYVDKRGQVCSYPLSNVLDVPSAELAKRLRYTKDILVNLLGARTGDLGVPADVQLGSGLLSAR